MSQLHGEYTHIIDAPPETIYGVLSDYRVGHPAILPKPYFTGLTVEQGGKGAGTIFQVHMAVLGMKVSYHMTVSEPEPGRVLVETDQEAGVTTTFTIEPLNNGQQSQVTIATDLPASPGFKGFMEKLINPSISRHIYKKELKQLAEYVQ